MFTATTLASLLVAAGPNLHLADVGTLPKLLASPEYRQTDPTWAKATTFTQHVTRFGKRQHVRVRPVIDGIPVEGADRLLSVEDGRIVRSTFAVPLLTSGRFILTYEDALASAIAAVPGALFVNPWAQPTKGLAVKRWLARGSGVRAAWRVRPLVLHPANLHDVWIDAETGAVLMTQPAVRFQAAPSAARVFEPAPNASGASAADLVDRTLGGLFPDEVGGYLRGYHLETFNCCKKYSCVTQDAACTDDTRAAERVCAPDTAGASSTPPAFPNQVDGVIPRDALPTEAQGFFPNGLFFRTVLCARLPRVVSRDAVAPDPAGWFETPVDVPRPSPDSTAHCTLANDGCSSETDPFAEIQAYHSTSIFFEHVRNILGDQDLLLAGDQKFCLAETSMSCDTDGGATIDQNTGRPDKAFHIAVNSMLPLLDYNDVLFQATPVLLGGLGRGGNAGNPVLIEDFQRVDNAAFIPGSGGGPVQVPPELQELAAQFILPFDSNLYFQGNRDFAYDGDVVYHEFTHAIVYTLAPDLLSSWHDEQGSHVEPGAMNEGWADYFSASFTNDSITGQYSAPGLDGETGLRDADNDAACPDALIGEVHQDSLPWSGALWEIRTTVATRLGAGAIADYDRLLLAAIAQADFDETMARQAQRIVDALTADAVLGPAGAAGSAIVDAATVAFGSTRHNLIACERIWPLRTVNAAGVETITSKDVLLQPAPGEVGLTNLAPSIMQMKVEVAPGATSLTMTWTQAAGGTASLTGGGTPTPLNIIFNESKPIGWLYNDNAGSILASPVDSDGAPITFDPTKPATLATLGAVAQGEAPASYSLTMTPNCLSKRTFYLAWVSTADPATLTSVSASATGQACPTTSNEPGGNDAGGCGCATASAGLLALAAPLALLRRRRRLAR